MSHRFWVLQRLKDSKAELDGELDGKLDAREEGRACRGRLSDATSNRPTFKMWPTLKQLPRLFSSSL